jgi:GntR family transcriptional regulator
MASPMYRQIAEDLRAQIDTGALEPGRQLQTELELRESYGASRNTVRDAIKLLTALGLVETKPGQGTFVVRKIDPHVTTLTTNPKTGPGGDITQDSGAARSLSATGKPRVVFSTDPQVEIQKATTLIANALQIAEGSQVISRHQKRSINGTPWAMQTSFYPMGFVVKGADKLLLADDIGVGTVQYLAETLGLRQVGYRDWISVRTPEVTEVPFFNLPPDGRVNVFEILRTGFDQTGTPMRLTITVYPTDRNQFIVNVGDVPETLSPDEQQ